MQRSPVNVLYTSVETVRHLAVDDVRLCAMRRGCAAAARLLIVEIPRVLVFTKGARRRARQYQEQR